MRAKGDSETFEAYMTSESYHPKTEQQTARVEVKRTDAFSAIHGRRPRVLMTTFGRSQEGVLDDRFATALADAGFDVDIEPVGQQPTAVARHAVEADVHAVYAHVLQRGELPQVQALREALHSEGADDILVAAFGDISVDETKQLENQGVAVFPPDASNPNKVERMLTELDSLAE